jgi:hypothetical protein
MRSTPCSFVALLFAFIAGCGGGVSGDGAPASSQPTAANLAVDASITNLELTQEPLGIAPPTPDACTGSYVKMTYDRSTHAATWKTCVDKAYVETARVLADGEATTLEKSLSAIAYDPTLACDGFDGTLFTMTTFTATHATQLYVHQNLNCYTSGRRRARNIPDTFDVLLGMQ